MGRFLCIGFLANHFNWMCGFDLIATRKAAKKYWNLDRSEYKEFPLLETEVRMDIFPNDPENREKTYEIIKVSSLPILKTQILCTSNVQINKSISIILDGVE